MSVLTLLSYLIGPWLFGWGMGMVWRFFMVYLEQWTS